MKEDPLLDDSVVSCRVDSDDGIMPMVGGVPCTGCNGNNLPF